LMATEVTPGKDSFSVGATVRVSGKHLVAGTAFETIYAVFPDGQRFVAASVREGSLHAPLTLLTNGAAALEPQIFALGSEHALHGPGQRGLRPAKEKCHEYGLFF